MITTQEEIQSRLSELRLRYKDADSNSIVDGLESQLKVLFKDKKEIESNPIFIKFSALLEQSINEATALLLNDESVLNEKGKEISSKREAYRRMASVLSIKLVDNAIEALTTQIDKI